MLKQLVAAALVLGLLPLAGCSTTDLVGGELGGVRPADVAVLVVPEQRVDAPRVLRREPGVGDHHLAGRVAIVLAEEVRPVFRVDVRAVDEVAGEQQVRVAVVAVERLLEQLLHATEVAHATLQIGAHEQPTVVG